jgi:hypothetical protein
MSKLSERENALLHMLPNLKEGEFRVAAQLILEAGESDRVAASVRELAQRTRCSTSTVQAALASLEARGMTSQVHGNRNTSTVWTLLFAGVKSIGVLVSDTRTGSTGVAAIATPQAENEENFSTSVAAIATPAYREQLHGVSVSDTRNAPAETHQKEIAGAPRARVDSDPVPEVDRSIDGILTAKAEDADTEALTEARSYLLSYMCKLGDPRSKPPDDAILAQFLAVAPWEGRGGLLELMHDLAGERAQPGDSYGWFVAVAAQRLRGIKPQELRARRDELRAQRRKRPQREGLEHASGVVAGILQRRREM